MERVSFHDDAFLNLNNTVDKYRLLYNLEDIMAQGKIIVTVQDLEKAASTVSTKAQEYQDNYNQLYKVIDELKGLKLWTGTDSDVFIEQLNQFKDDFDYMYSLMNQYSTFIKKAAQAYSGVQSTITNETKDLKINR